MNRQRSRRFQTAQGAKELKEKGERNGEKLLHETASTVNVSLWVSPKVFIGTISYSHKHFCRDSIHGSTIRADAIPHQLDNYGGLELAWRSGSGR